MAGSILRDEATLEDNLREKNVLLKEVHHRVKNNLQLISSVVNMEGRRVADAAARAPLGRLQDRIMGLALVHRALYQSDDLHRIDLRRLLRELAQQAGQGGAALGPAPAVEGPDGIALDPDRAVPLSLLVSEALTNAQRHGAGGARIHVSVEAGEVRLRIENPVAAEGAGGADAEPGGARLGSQLIRAFAQQVGGRLETGADGSGTYAVELRFPEEASKPPAKDY
nr:sensor histidine kinase [Jannaschia sp. Os4]